MTISPKQKPLPSKLAGRPEPKEILAGLNLAGKTALITGGYSGIGLEAVRALKDAGANVFVPARDKARAQKALADILPAEKIGDMDLGDLNSVRKFADDFASAHKNIDIIIANAGVMATPEQKTAQGLEYQIGVNHFGHFALITALQNNFAERARVVTLSSIGHIRGGVMLDDLNFEKTPYEKWRSYGQSKSAQSLMAVALDKRLQNGARALAVHPGGIFTPLQRHLQNEEMVALGWTKEDGSASERAAAIFKTPAQGCGTSLWAATSAQLAENGGVYCEDCEVAELVSDDFAQPSGVRKWAVDEDIAERFWALSEKTLASL